MSDGRSTCSLARLAITPIVVVHLVTLAGAFALPRHAHADESTASSPSRVVSVGGALTEIVYALGVEDALVGVDTTSLHPAAAAELPEVGYQRNLSAEGVLSLGPDIVLVTDDAGPPEVLDQIEAAGVAIERLPSEHTLEAVTARVRTLAERFARVNEGEALVARIEAEMADARTLAAEGGVTPRALFLLGTGAGSAMAAGGDTAADAMLRYAGAENVLAEIDGYKPVSAESMIAAAPDTIVVVAHGEGDPEGIVDDALKVPGVSATPAGRTRHVVVADALRLLGFGPRIGEATRELAERLREAPSE